VIGLGVILRFFDSRQRRERVADDSGRFRNGSRQIGAGFL
jgi:hypothetical protein